MMMEQSEPFLEGISGQAHITVKMTELNRPLGLDVQLHITAAICPAISEPGLRALLRFMTGLYICLNRGEVFVATVPWNHLSHCSMWNFCRDQLKRLASHWSLLKMLTSSLTCRCSHFTFLGDTFSRFPCTLVQPSIQSSSNEPLQIPEFAKNFFPPIYPLGEADWQIIVGVPLISLYSLQDPPGLKDVHQLPVSYGRIMCEDIFVLGRWNCRRPWCYLT